MLHPSRNWTLALIASAGLLLFAASASAQSETANASAEILVALTLDETAALDYGRIASSATAGTAVVTQGGAKSCTGGATCVGTATAGEFDVTGAPSETVDVTVPANYTLTSGLNSMTAVPDAPATVALGLLGTATFNVGGTLTVAASQASGNYAGTYTISVAYQ
jgi:hypothetical protein